MEMMEGFDDLDAFLENLIQELERRSPNQGKSDAQREAQRNDKGEQAPLEENETGQGPTTTFGSPTTNRLEASATLGVSPFGGAFGALSSLFGRTSLHPFGETFSGGKRTEIETPSPFVPSVDVGGIPTRTRRKTPFKRFRRYLYSSKQLRILSGKHRSEYVVSRVDADVTKTTVPNDMA